MDSNSNTNNDVEFERVLEMSRQEYNSNLETNFEYEVEQAIQESKDIYNSNMTIPEQDIIDNFGDPCEEEEEFIEDEENNTFTINVLPLSTYPWDDRIVDYLETSNTFIGTQELLNQITQKNLFELSDLITFKFNETYALTPHDFIIGNDCYIPSKLFNDLGLNIDDNNNQRKVDIEFIPNIEKGTKIILQTNDEHFMKILDQKKLCDENIPDKYKVLTQGQSLRFYSSDLIDFIDFTCISTNNQATIKITDTDLEVDLMISDELAQKLKEQREEKERLDEKERLNKMIQNLNKTSHIEKKIESSGIKLGNNESYTPTNKLSTDELRERRLKFLEKKVSQI